MEVETKIRTEKQAKHLSKHDPTGRQWAIGDWYYLVPAEAPERKGKKAGVKGGVNGR